MEGPSRKAHAVRSRLPFLVGRSRRCPLAKLEETSHFHSVYTRPGPVEFPLGLTFANRPLTPVSAAFTSGELGEQPCEELHESDFVRTEGVGVDRIEGQNANHVRPPEHRHCEQRAVGMGRFVAAEIRVAWITPHVAAHERLAVAERLCTESIVVRVAWIYRIPHLRQRFWAQARTCPYFEQVCAVGDPEDDFVGVRFAPERDSAREPVAQVAESLVICGRRRTCTHMTLPAKRRLDRFEQDATTAEQERHLTQRASSLLETTRGLEQPKKFNVIASNEFDEDDEEIGDKEKREDSRGVRPQRIEGARDAEIRDVESFQGWVGGMSQRRRSRLRSVHRLLKRRG